MAEITLNNIKQFFQGNSRMFANKLGNKFGIPFLKTSLHNQEQIFYRASLCKDCEKLGHCQACSCPVPNKWFADKACEGKRYPDLMSKEKWEEYKKVNNIVIDLNVHDNK